MFSISDIRKKLGNLTKLWDHLQKATDDRGRSLDDALAISERFWSELQGVMRALKNLQDALGNQEPPAIQPSAIKEQQKELQEIRQGIEQTKPEVDQVRRSGQDLMKVCGAPEKPEVKKNLADLDSAWDNITALYARREENLIDAMEKAMEFHDTLQVRRDEGSLALVVAEARVVPTAAVMVLPGSWIQAMAHRTSKGRH